MERRGKPQYKVTKLKAKRRGKKRGKKNAIPLHKRRKVAPQLLPHPSPEPPQQEPDDNDNIEENPPARSQRRQGIIDKLGGLTDSSTLDVEELVRWSDFDFMRQFGVEDLDLIAPAYAAYSARTWLGFQASPVVEIPVRQTGKHQQWVEHYRIEQKQFRFFEFIDFYGHLVNEAIPSSSSSSSTVTTVAPKVVGSLTNPEGYALDLRGLSWLLDQWVYRNVKGLPFRTEFSMHWYNEKGELAPMILGGFIRGQWPVVCGMFREIMDQYFQERGSEIMEAGYNKLYTNNPMSRLLNATGVNRVLQLTIQMFGTFMMIGDQRLNRKSVPMGRKIDYWIPVHGPWQLWEFGFGNIKHAICVLATHEILRNVLVHEYHPPGFDGLGASLQSDSTQDSSVRFHLISFQVTIVAHWVDNGGDLGVGSELNQKDLFNKLDDLRLGDPDNKRLAAYGRQPFDGEDLVKARVIDRHGEGVNYHPKLLIYEDSQFDQYEDDNGVIRTMNYYRNLDYILFDNVIQYRLMLPRLLNRKPVTFISGFTSNRRRDLMNPEDYLHAQILIQQGGCYDMQGRTGLPHSLRRVTTFYPTIHSTGNNCLFACLFYMGKESIFRTLLVGNSVEQTHELIRQYCGFQTGVKIAVEDHDIIVQKYPLRLETYVIKEQPPDGFGSHWIALVHVSEAPKAQLTVRVLLQHEHYYCIAKDVGLTFRRCASCYKWLSLTSKFKQHLHNCKRCPNCYQPISLTTGHRCRGRLTTDCGDRMTLKKMTCPEKYVAETDLYWFDFETSPFEMGTSQHVVYAASVMGSPGTTLEKAPLTFYGLDSLKKFINAITGLHGTMVAFNGSAFDFILIFRYLIKEQPGVFDREVKDVVMKDNRILSFKFGKLLFMDLYLFLRSSLKQACKDLKVPAEYCKGEFDHTKMKDFAALTTYKKEVIEYLELDVHALRCCYSIFAKSVWENYHVNINDYTTGPHMAYVIWLTMLPDGVVVMVPKLEEDKFYRRGLFGGRCGPQVPLYTSTEVDKIMKMFSIDRLEITDEEFASIQDYCILLDVVSLYPSVMMKFLFPCGPYSIHDLPERESDYTPAAKNAIKRLYDLKSSARGGFYEVDIQPPTNILTPFLQERTAKGGLIYDLKPKYHQVYTSIELKEAIRLGYKITKVHKYAVFRNMENLFGPFITKCFEIKKASPKGSVPYMVAKLLMNSLSGKQSQKVITTEYKFYTTENDIREKLSDPSVSDIKLLFSDDTDDDLGSKEKSTTDESKVIGALVKTERDDPKPSKCCYLGAFILGGARVLMSRYLRLVYAYMMPQHMYYYTDTDSFVMRRETVELLRKQDKVVGKDLGNLSDDLDGGKIVRAIFLNPKSYILEYITAGNPHRLKWRVRCKGIPHDEAPIDCGDVINGKYAGHHGMVYELYSVGEEEKLITTNKCITFEMFQKMLNNEGRVKVSMDTLKRALCDCNFRRCIGIYNVTMKRTMNKTPFWTDVNKRICAKMGDMIVSYPPGHQAIQGPTEEIIPPLTITTTTRTTTTTISTLPSQLQIDSLPTVTTYDPSTIKNDDAPYDIFESILTENVDNYPDTDTVEVKREVVEEGQTPMDPVQLLLNLNQ